MATRDAFLDALTLAWDGTPKQAVVPAVVVPRAPTAPSAPTERLAAIETVLGSPDRPAFADAIDEIVHDMVAAGDVVFDVELGAYRRPHCRRFRFGRGE